MYFCKLSINDARNMSNKETVFTLNDKQYLTCVVLDTILNLQFTKQDLEIVRILSIITGANACSTYVQMLNKITNR